MFDPYMKIEWSSRRSLPVRSFRHLLHKFRELLHVPGLDLDQLLDSLQIVGVVGYGVEGIRNADVVVGPVGAFGDHDVGSHAREVGLISEREQVEHQLHLVWKVIQFPDRSIGNLEAGKISWSRPSAVRRSISRTLSR